MNDGVALLLERMKTHPEEFVIEEGVPAKWDNLIRSYETILDPEDVALFRQARGKLLQQQFTEKVLEGLVDPKPLKDLEIPIRIGQMNAMPSVGQTLASSLTQSKPWITAGVLTSNTNSLTLGSTTINESHLEHMKAHVEALQKEYADVFNKPKKEHKTIFGRLFNYQ